MMDSRPSAPPQPDKIGKPAEPRASILPSQEIIDQMRNNGYYTLPPGTNVAIRAGVANYPNEPDNIAFSDLGDATIQEPIEVIVKGISTGHSSADGQDHPKASLQLSSPLLRRLLSQERRIERELQYIQSGTALQDLTAEDRQTIEPDQPTRLSRFTRRLELIHRLQQTARRELAASILEQNPALKARVKEYESNTSIITELSFRIGLTESFDLANLEAPKSSTPPVAHDLQPFLEELPLEDPDMVHAITKAVRSVQDWRDQLKRIDTDMTRPIVELYSAETYAALGEDALKKGLETWREETKLAMEKAQEELPHKITLITHYLHDVLDPANELEYYAERFDPADFEERYPDGALGELGKLVTALWDPQRPIGQALIGDEKIVELLDNRFGREIPRLLFAIDLLRSPEGAKAIGAEGLSNDLADLLERTFHAMKTPLGEEEFMRRAEVGEVVGIVQTHIEAARENGYLHLSTPEAVTQRIEEAKQARQSGSPPDPGVTS